MINKKTVPFIWGIIAILIVAIAGGFFIWRFQPEIFQPAWEKINLKEKNIAVESPRAGEKITFPLTVTGRARVFENTINYRVLDADTKAVVASGFATADAPDIGQFGDFSFEIIGTAKSQAAGQLILQVYWASPKDGSDLDVVNIPVTYEMAEGTALKLFFSNNNLDPEISCNEVFPVERFVSKTLTPARTALEMLLSGPNNEEFNQGYYSSINQGTKINSLKIENGVATVDFNETIQAEVGGSCRVSIIRQQIEQTLKQFPTVKKVTICVAGNCQQDEILQP